jgi:hypothetical protein
MLQRLQKLLSIVWNNTAKLFESRILKIAIFLVCILLVGPWAYVALEIPKIMKPVNYYDFLNSFLLISLIIISITRKRE